MRHSQKEASGSPRERVLMLALFGPTFRWTRGLLMCVLALFAASTTAPRADEGALIDFSIPAQSLSSALIEFSRQAKVQVLTAGNELQNVNTGGVSGKMSVTAGIQRLLAGTGFGYRLVGSDTISLTAPSAKQSGLSSPLLAQGDSTATSDITAAPGVSQQEEDARGEKRSSQAQQLEPVMVTGSRLPRSATEGPQEVNIYSRQQIEASGQSTVVGFLNTLSEVSVSSSPSGIGGGVGGTTTVQLRGLPAGTTLVLVDGRRVDRSDVTTTFDLNNLPVTAVERIEILPTGSSAIYGSDALAGVVNIILKKLDGFEASVHYGHASGSDDSNIGLGWGTAGDRGSFSIVGSFFDQSELSGDERSITANANYTSMGGTDQRRTTCSPGNVYSANGSNLPGLNSSFAAIPAGLSGPPTVEDFSATAGILNRCGGSYSSTALIEPSQRFGVVASGDYRIFPNVKVFAEAILNRTLGDEVLYKETYSKQTLSASNPFNPFGQSVLVSGVINGAPPIDYDSRTDFIDPVIGIRGRIRDKWDWELSVSDPRSNQQISAVSTNSTALASALASTSASTAFNPFTTASPVSSPAVLSGLYQTSNNQYLSQTLMANGYIRGPIWTLPSGPIDLVLGAEYDRDHEMSASGSSSSLVNSTYRRDIYSLFGEVRIPIIGNHDHPQAGDILSVTLADRFDHYDDFGSSTNPQYGIEWRPSETFLIRSTYAQAYLAPSTVSLYRPQSIFPTQVSDPLNNNEVVTVPGTYGGNPSLQPQKGQSRSMGFVWSSKAIKGLDMSMTYWGIDESDRLTTVTGQTIVSNESLFPGRVVRGPSENGAPGQIQSINVTNVNLGSLSVSGFDLSGRYRFKAGGMGEFTPNVTITQIYKYVAGVIPGSPLSSRDSVATSNDAWAPRYKGTVAMNWKLAWYSADISARYVGRYRDYAPLVNGSYQTLGNFWLFDLFGKYEWGRAMTGGSPYLKGAYTDIGIVNLFNTLPQYSTFYAGYDPQEADIRGRYIYLDLGLRW